MQPAGWAIMILSVASVFTGCAYCIYRVLTLPPIEVEEHLHAPLDIKTPDGE
jgi:hypothetical protein